MKKTTEIKDTAMIGWLQELYLANLLEQETALTWSQSKAMASKILNEMSESGIFYQ